VVSSPAKRPAVELALVCLAVVAIFVPGLWNRDLWHPLEPAYAQIAYEMVASGNWLDLTRNGEPYYNKPPLIFWLEGLAIEAFGRHTASVRLPSMVFGMGTLLLTYLIARHFGINPLISSLVLASSWAYSLTCQQATIDVTLCFLILLAFYLYLQSGEPGRRSWTWGVGAALAVALAVLAKGPVALLCVACAVLPYAVWRRRWKEIVHWKWLAGGLIVAAIAVTWLLVMRRHEGAAFYKVVFGRELGGNFDPESKAARSLLYYLADFPSGFVPWILYFPAAVVLAWERRNESVLQVLLWFATTLVAFSLVPAKAGRYIVPLFPAAALLVGAYLTDRDSRLGLVALWGYAALAVGVVVGSAVAIPAALPYSAAFGAFVLAFAVLGLILWPRIGSRALVMVAMAALFALSTTLIPYRNQTKSPRPMARFLNSQGAKQEDIVWVCSYEAGVAFYGGYTKMTRVTELDSLEAYPHAFVIAEPDYVKEHSTAFGTARLLGRFQIGTPYYLVFKTP
jgi:4-amino-4-deoxy-L-arabinose transferase-like glycosyltransferase